MSSRMKKMRGFIADFRALRESHRADRREAMTAFLSTFDDVHRRIWRSRVDFNVFRLLGVRFDEVTHSAVLA